MVVLPGFLLRLRSHSVLPGSRARKASFNTHEPMLFEEGWFFFREFCFLARFGKKSHSAGSVVMLTLISPSVSTMTRSVFESKAMPASFRLVISVETRTPSSFFW